MSLSRRWTRRERTLAAAFLGPYGAIFAEKVARQVGRLIEAEAGAAAFRAVFS